MPARVDCWAGGRVQQGIVVHGVRTLSANETF